MRLARTGSDAMKTASAPSVTLEAALDYEARGWAVFPIWWAHNGGCSRDERGCKDPAKHPLGKLVPNGLKNATTDESTIRQWWGRFPRANVGIVTGARSGLVVIDIDRPKGGIESMAQLEHRHGSLTIMPEVVTRGDGAAISISDTGDLL